MTVEVICLVLAGIAFIEMLMIIDTRNRIREVYIDLLRYTEKNAAFALEIAKNIELLTDKLLKHIKGFEVTQSDED